ncbi:EamA family transporter [Leptolyngbya sp. AN02str]|uniref:EamA family transporter n=1 Tax=Leptolyngbya sp. AN02str TaxID=3423363 RepID=UPI003D3211B8
MALNEFLLLLSSILIGVAGQFFLKAGALKLGRVEATNAISHILKIAITPELLFGLACYGLASIAYILVLTRVKLSIVGPSVALSYVFAVLLGYFVFKETIPPARLVGLGCIIAGVILVIWQQK